jgi:8-oxo-dGTP diphosphatase
MDPTAPDGCAGAGRGWAGNPLETAHLRLRAVEQEPLRVIIEERLSGAEIGSFTIEFLPNRKAQLAADWQYDAIRDGLAGESLRRCLRMLFDNFGIGLVEADFSPGNQAFTDLCSELGFRGDRLGRLRLSAEDWSSWRARRTILSVVAAAMIDVDGRVLLAQRPAGKSMAGQWEFPGGKLAPGESPEQALIRELREELAIDVAASCLAPLAFASHDYDHFHLVMPLFALRQWSGKPVAQEGQTLAWVAKDRLADYRMPPADIPLVAQLRDWL